MALSKQQEEEMYAGTLKACESITWIRERLEAGDRAFLVGGNYGFTGRAGVFDTRINYTPDYAGVNVGFRAAL